jgi:phage portal protein BeeE
MTMLMLVCALGLIVAGATVPVYSAVSLLAGSIGSLPLIVYRRLGDGRERAENHRTWPLLHDQPNPEMAADELWELVMAHLLLWGNAFLGRSATTSGSSPSSGRYAQPRAGRPRRPGHRYFVLDGKRTRLRRGDDILHIRGLGTDGLVGLSPGPAGPPDAAGAMAIEEFTGPVLGERRAAPASSSAPEQAEPGSRDRNLKATGTRRTTQRR